MSNEQGRRGLVLGAAAVLAVIVVAVYFISRPGSSVKPVPAPVTGAAPASAPPAAGTETSPAAAAAVPVAATPPAATLSVPELLKNAGTALSERRLIEPAGNNAVEYYLLVLDKDANNAAARDGLREMFPLATGAVEQQINAGQIETSLRMINLLGKADPTNYTLTILRNKLDLKKKQVERDQEKRDQEKQLAANAGRIPPAATAPAPGAAAPGPAAAPPATAPATAAAPAPATPGATTPTSTAAAASAPAAAGGAGSPATAASGNRAATLLQKTNPNYPPDAARKHQEGWVEVGFTVGPDGHVKDAVVVGANPARVFNDAALHAVGSWTFEPRLENGQPVEQHIKSRIEFKLGNG